MHLSLEKRLTRQYLTGLAFDELNGQISDGSRLVMAGNLINQEPLLLFYY